MNLTVIGIGRLGICNALCFEKVRYRVLGVDIFENYVRAVNDKSLSSYEPKVEEYLKNSNNLRATTSLKEGLEFSNIIFIVIDTPNSGDEKFYDHKKLSNLLTRINDQKVKNKHIVICCTVMPSYINQIGKYLLSDCEDTTLNYNPEFIAQGQIIDGLQNPDMILIGEETKEAGDLIEEITQKTCQNRPHICRMSPLEAEITKISLNGYLTTKISFANLIGDASKKLGANPEVILEAIGKDSRIGNKFLKYGHSYGGPCLPRDTRALAQFIRNTKVNPILMEATNKYNILHTELEVEELLKKNQDLYIIEDICYKENSHVPIIEESAKLKIAKELVKRGKKVIIKDLKHMIRVVKMEYGNLFSYEIK